MAVAMAVRRFSGGRGAGGQLALMRRHSGQQLRRLSSDSGSLPQSAVRYGACASTGFCGQCPVHLCCAAPKLVLTLGVCGALRCFRTWSSAAQASLDVQLHTI